MRGAGMSSPGMCRRPQMSSDQMPAIGGLNHSVVAGASPRDPIHGEDIPVPPSLAIPARPSKEKARRS